MAAFSVHILGCGSASPSLRHQPSCQVVDFRDQLLMIDCGEGAQLAMRRQGLKFSRIRHIFISHLHGDHFFGLPGLLSTMALHDVRGTVTVHVFSQGAAMLRRLMAMFCGPTPFTLEYDQMDPRHGAVVLDTPALSVTTVPLSHRVPAVGFVFRQKPGLPHLRGDLAQALEMPNWARGAVKAGADWTAPDGTVYTAAQLTTPGDPEVSYGYCSDTAWTPRLARDFQGVDVLYHEATYADDQAHKAAPRGHSTAREAARTARDAGAGRLVLGHFSKSYLSEDGHVAQALEEWPQGRIQAADEGMTIDLARPAADND